MNDEEKKAIEWLKKVEILEDNTEKIEELKPVEDGTTYRYEWSEISNKINELVRAVNKLMKG